MLASEHLRRRVPWTTRAFSLAYVCAVGGLLVIGVAWFGASSSVTLNSQLRWADVGVAGLILLGAGNIAWLLTGRRAVGELRRHVLATVSPREVTVEEPATSAAGGVLVSGAGMSHYHRPDCLFVAGRQVRRASRQTFERRGRRPCRVCLPE
jgi:hypothetical protein